MEHPRPKVLAVGKKSTSTTNRKQVWDVNSCSQPDAASAGDQDMWKSSKCVAMAIAGAGLTVAAATRASACFDWGYSGIYSHGLPYANTGFASYPAYGYRSCSGSYNIPGWGECGGYGHCGWAPLDPPVVAVPATAGAAPGELALAGQPVIIRPVTKTRKLRRSLME